jgi:hypothetical protein
LTAGLIFADCAERQLNRLYADITERFPINPAAPSGWNRQTRERLLRAQNRIRVNEAMHFQASRKVMEIFRSPGSARHQAFLTFGVGSRLPAVRRPGRTAQFIDEDALP